MVNRPVDSISALVEHYPEVIASMNTETFSSHQFILELARIHQNLYIEALMRLRHHRAPFRVLHGILARRLKNFHYLVTLDPAPFYDNNIFNKTCRNALWHRVH